MEVVLTPIEDVIAMKSYPQAKQIGVDFIPSGTPSCLLNCQRQSTKKSRKAALSKTDQFKVADVAASAEAGCRGCRFLRALLSGMLLAYPELKAQDPLLKWADSPFTLEITAKVNSVRKVQFFYPRGAQIRIVGMPPSNLLAGDTGSIMSFDRTYRYILECETKHGNCGSGRGVILPKRLLQVNEIHNASGDLGIRLETTEGKTGTYACLSHCWGDPTLIISQTLTTTIHGYHRFISWVKLPKSFQNAVAICRKLGLEYLWIDSLCIIQDSRTDWEKESSNMGEIYGNSYITIAASASPGSFGGCFSKSIPDTCLTITEPGHPDTLVAIRDCQGAGKVVKNMNGAFANHFPLFGRAWAYQERMLSRRILYCNRAEFQVGCKEALNCECGSRRIAPHFYPSPRGFNAVELRRPSELTPHEGGGGLVGIDFTTLLYRNWLEVVEAYAKLDLTKGSDKLPALSAAAKTIARNMGSDYLAGIWRISLMEGLLWYVRAPLSKPRPKGLDWRAPSWSWASIDAPSGLGYISPGNSFSNSFHTKIEAAECVPAGHDNMGQVTSGFIRVKVSLGSTFWRMRCRTCTTVAGRKGRKGLPCVDYTLHTTGGFDPPGASRKRCAFSQPTLDLMGSDLGFFADAVVDSLNQYGFVPCIGKGTCKVAPCYLLYVHRNDNRFGSRKMVGEEKRIHTDAFLALTRVNSKQDTFERIGLVSISHATEKRKDQWFKQVWSSIVLPETTITLV